MLPNVRLDVPGDDRHGVLCPFWKQQCFVYKPIDKGMISTVDDGGVVAAGWDVLIS